MPDVLVTPSNYPGIFAAPRSGKTRYLLGPGRYPDAYWPSDVIDYDIEVIPMDRANPPIVEALSIGAPGNLAKGNFYHLRNAPKGTRFTKRIKIDGIDFRCPRYKVIGGIDVTKEMADGDGLGWRVQGTSHPSASLVGGKENGGYSGLRLYTNGSAVEVVNCLFDGYAIQFGWYGDGGSCDVHHNRFQNLPEDAIKWSSGNLTIRQNVFWGVRQPTERIANYSGGPSRPHSDAMQSMSGWDNVRIFENFIYAEGHMNGGQIKQAQSSARCTGLYLVNNRVISRSGTAFWLNNFGRRPNGQDIMGTGVDIYIARNKCDSGGQPWLDGEAIFGNTGQDYGDARIIIEDNYVPKEWTGPANSRVTKRGNKATNDPNDYPPGWIEVDPRKIPAGLPRPGRYGETGGVPGDGEPPVDPDPPVEPEPPVEPPVDPPVDPQEPRALVEGEIDIVMVGEARFGFIVPGGSPAAGCEIRWAYDTDATPQAPKLAKKTDTTLVPGVHVADSADGSHVLPAGATRTVHAYYQGGPDSLPRSAISAVSWVVDGPEPPIEEPPVKPAALQDGEWNFDPTLSAHPTLPGQSIGVIRIAPWSPAFEATAVWWAGAGEIPVPTIDLGVSASGFRRWRMASVPDAYAVAAGETSPPIGVHYATSAAPDMSDRSETDLTYSLPPAEEPEPPVPVEVRASSFTATAEGGVVVISYVPE